MCEPDRGRPAPLGAALAVLAFLFLFLQTPGASGDARIPEFEGAPAIKGFRGMQWGANPSAFSGLIKSKSDRTVQRFRKKNDRLTLGDVRLQSITYNFYKGRFMGVTIQARGAQNWGRLKRAAFEKFGPADNASPVPSTEQYEWRGDNCVTHLQFFASSRTVKLWISAAGVPGISQSF